MAEHPDFINRSSEEQAEVNAEVAARPTGSLADETSAQTLTGHTNEQSVVKDEDGRTIAVHLTQVITDPSDSLAVQVPDPDAYPQINGAHADERAVNTEPSPNEVAAGEDKPAPKAKSSKDD